MALSMPIRCFSPPDNSLGYLFIYNFGFNPTFSSKSFVFSAISFLSNFFISGIRAIFSSTVRFGNNAICWRTYPVSRRNSLRL